MFALSQNSTEDKHLFRNGMSVSDLFQAYISYQPYLNHSQWGICLCLYSDLLWGYFMKFYYLAVHQNSNDGQQQHQPPKIHQNDMSALYPEDRISAYCGSWLWVGNVCKQEVGKFLHNNKPQGEMCTIDAHFLSLRDTNNTNAANLPRIHATIAKHSIQSFHEIMYTY
jgi:hypothetical protein